MNQVIGMMTFMQDLAYIPLSKVPFPATTMLVYSSLIEMVTFELCPTDDWFKWWFNLPTGRPFSPEFEAFDYGSTNFMYSIGTLWIFWVLLLMKYPFYWLFSSKSNWRLCRYLKNNLREELFWSAPVEFMLGGYIEFAIAVFVNYSEFI